MLWNALLTNTNFCKDVYKMSLYEINELFWQNQQTPQPGKISVYIKYFWFSKGITMLLRSCPKTGK